MDRILLDGVRYGRHIFNLGHGVFPEADPKSSIGLQTMYMNAVVNYGHKRGKLVNIEKKDYYSYPMVALQVRMI